MPSNNVETLLNVVFDVSTRETARWLSVDQSRVSRWKTVDQPPLDLALAFGVRYDFIVGESEVVWSDKVVAMRRELRLYLATIDARTMTTSKRVTTVLAWLSNHAPQSLGGAAGVERYLAALLRMIDRNGSIDAYRDVATGVTPASKATVKRLADWCDVPVEWFEKGDRRLLDDSDPYDNVVRLAKSLGVSAADVETAIRRLAQRDSVI